MADHKKTDDKKPETTVKPTKKVETKDRLLEIGKALGGIVAVLFVTMDARVRPLIANAVKIAERYGLRGSRFVRQLVDRHLVASILRPLLAVSTLTVTMAYALGWYWLYAFGVDGLWALGGVGKLLGFIALAATLAAAVLLFLVRNVRGLLDSRIHTLRAEIVATLFPAGTTLNEEQRQWVSGVLQQRMLREFGRPGYAPRLAFALIAQWVIAGVWFIALAVVLQTWHLGEMRHANVDPRWTSGLVVMGGVLLSGAFGWLMLAISIAQAALKYGLRIMLWTVRLVAKPLVEVLDFTTDDEEVETVVAKDLGLPLQEWSDSLGAVLGLPVGVLAGLLMLLATGHSLNQAAFVVVDAFVLLMGYFFLVKMAGIKNEYIYRMIVIIHFVWAVGQFLLWAIQPTWVVNVVAANGRIVPVSAGEAAHLYALLVTPTFVFLFLAIAFGAAWLGKKASGKPALALYTVAVIFAVMGLGMVLARSALATAPPPAPAVSAANGGNGLNLGDLVPQQTVNAGSHSAPRSNCHMMSDGSCVPY